MSLIALLALGHGCDDAGEVAADSALPDAAQVVADMGQDAGADGPIVDVGVPDAQPDVAQPDAFPGHPVEPARPAAAERVHEGSATGVAVSQDRAVFFTTADELRRVEGAGSVGLGAVDAPVAGAVAVDGGWLVLLGEQLTAVDELGLLETPLAERLPVVEALVGAEGGAWIAADGLYRLADGLSAVRPQGLPTTDALIAPGRYGDAPALWVAAGGQVYALEQGDALLAWPTMDRAATSLAAASDGSVWVVGEGLWRADAEGVQAVPEVEGATVAGHPESDQVWIRAVDGELWQFREGHLIPRPGAPDGPLAVTANGSVWIAAEDGLYVVRAGQFVALRGVPAELLEATTIQVDPTEPESVTEVVGGVDGAEAPIAPPWTVLLDPVLLEPGPHVFAVTVEYADGARITTSAHFSIPEVYIPTWTEDIEPLFVEHCAQCHGPRRNAHRMETVEVWRDEIDDILDAVRVGRMPLDPNPPLSPAAIQLIVDWKAAGMPE